MPEGLVVGTCLCGVALTRERVSHGVDGGLGQYVSRLQGLTPLAFAWPEFVCAKLEMGTTCVSRKSGMPGIWKQSGDPCPLPLDVRRLCPAQACSWAQRCSGSQGLLVFVKSAAPCAGLVVFWLNGFPLCGSLETLNAV